MIELVEKVPPNILYHGTNHKYITGILARGIEKKMNSDIHLRESSEKSYSDAIAFGGRIVICTINAKKMYEDGHKFYIDDNNVWTTDYVPTKYFKPMFVNVKNDLKHLPKEIEVK